MCLKTHILAGQLQNMFQLPIDVLFKDGVSKAQIPMMIADLLGGDGT